MNTKEVLLLIILMKRTDSETSEKNNVKYSDFEEHTLVSDGRTFPYVAAILKKTTYICSGALIDDSWVLTAADPLLLIQESSRIIRVRLGSTNYKKGGLVLPIKFYEFHPYFVQNKPSFDLALIRLADSVSFTPNISPIRLLKSKRELATHFTVASWSLSAYYSSESDQILSLETINRRRVLTLARLHPSEPEECSDELQDLGVNRTDAVLCLDNGNDTDPCLRDSGAPVVHDNTLWGIISSWKPDDCENELVGPSFANVVFTADVSTWILAVTSGHKWSSSGH